MKYWRKEKGNNSIIWRNIVNISLTVEIHKLDNYELSELEEAKYYVFPAKNGKGIPNSPELFVEKEDAISYAKKYMENWLLDKKEGI